MRPTSKYLNPRVHLLLGAVGLFTCTGWLGCAAHLPDTGKLSKRIEELAQREEQNQRQIDELNNRLFLLEDRVDTSRVALERRGAGPRMPVIRIASPVEPDPSSGTDEAEESGDERGVVSRDEEPTETNQSTEQEEQEEGPIGSLVATDEVTYSGEAAEEGPRPVLRLHGMKASSSGRRFIGPDPSQVTEKLPVVPLPKRRVARKIAAAIRPMQEYNAAMKKYKTGQYAMAAEAFSSFFKRYGKHTYADNSLYWLGECFYDMKKYQLAVKMFRQVVEQYPAGNKAPDALLKMAYCYLRLKAKDPARTILAEVKASYPKSRVARLASEALKKL